MQTISPLFYNKLKKSKLVSNWNEDLQFRALFALIEMQIAAMTSVRNLITEEWDKIEAKN